MKAEIVSVGTASSSTYNGDGLRMSHTISGAATNYVWDVASALPVVLTDGSNTLVYGLDLISSTDSGGNQTYYLYDGLGSTVNLTNTSGNSTQSYTYWAFGDHHVGPPPGSNQWLFTGEQRDTDSGLYYLRARYYDPAIGRFLGRDPLPGGNLYTYTSNNPVNRTDPSGLCFGLGDCGIIDDVAHASISVGSDLTVEQFQDLYDGADALPIIQRASHRYWLEQPLPCHRRAIAEEVMARPIQRAAGEPVGCCLRS